MLTPKPQPTNAIPTLAGLAFLAAALVFAPQYAIGEADASRRIEVVYSTSNVNVWNNAIFANGQGGNTINGNVSIYGGVHVLGEGITPGDDAISTTDAIDMSGTSFIRNSYEMGAGQNPGQRVWDSIPAPPTTVVDGQEVEYLNASLRVKNGDINLEGAASAGLPDDPDSPHKQHLQGVYANGNIKQPEKVFSDNGAQVGYGLSDKVPIPRLDDDYRDRVTGDRVPHPDGGYYSHQDYFTEVLVDRPSHIVGAPPSILRGELRLQVDGTMVAYNGENPFVGGSVPSGGSSNNFYYNATMGVVLQGNHVDAAAILAELDRSNDFLLWDSAAGRLHANGQIAIEGNLHILGGQGTQVEFTGKAAIMVVDGEARHAPPNPDKGNITINTNLLSLNADGTYGASYPNPNLLGFMADSNLALGGRAQLVQMGAFYAEGSISIDRQTHTVGTIVADWFDMGGQVPNIYQVPVLADSLPLGIVGDWPIFATKEEAWRELKPKE